MASVAPSPEVVVERSVVAGSVVEGGAGDVVVAGSLVAGPVVAGLVTTGPPQHFCSYCGVWMSGDPESLRRHYEGARHKDREAKKEEGNSYWAICCGNFCASYACGNCSCEGGDGDCVNPCRECCSCLQECCSCGGSCLEECCSCLCENECCSCLC